MINHVRIATPAEIEKIRAQADLEMPCQVLALDHTADQASLAVVRQAIELDPVFFGQANNMQKARFIYALEERLMGAGIGVYYFNVAESNKEWQDTIRSWGAEQVSPGAELRFKRLLP